MWLLAVLTGVFGVWIIASAGRSMRRTTLFTAWCWGLAFSLMGVSMGLLDGVLTVLSRNWSEIFWYLTAITGVCPSIAVLGARRPVNRVWNLFVIVPLLAVLGWPAMTVLLNGSNPQRLHLEAPPLVAFGLVMLMGYGNYIGTRYGWCAVLAAAGEGLLVSPLALTPPFDTALRPLGLICIGAALALARVLTRTWPSPGDGLQRVWEEFRNCFGIVWSRRIMERFNQKARQQQWSVRLKPGGFAWDGDPAVAERERADAEQFLRWLLRRFVDDDWFAVRMRSSRS